MRQLTLPFCHDEGFLKSYLEEGTGKTVSLVITDNSTCVLSLKGKGRSVVMRLHKMFLSAGREVLDEMVDFVNDTRRKTPRIRDFINQNSHWLKKQIPRDINIQAQGKHYNLLDIYHSINQEYFDGKVSSPITWGSRRIRRVAGERTLGSYCYHNHIIRINPVLDTKSIPRYFLEYIVYHEMLHADLGVEDNGGRNSYHSREFKRREKLFKHYERSLAWEKKRW
ncbi:hypothetical protein EP227_07630 [bacterium]|nr:MAG: hypothetical protein EP227_07630 [bacterium]